MVKQALAYICENYRIERRVIRNRRQLISEKMARRTLCAIPYSPLSLNESYNEIGAIQNTLAYLADNGKDDEEYVTQTAIPLLSALFSSPWAFEDALHKLQIDDGILLDSAAAWRRQAENEHSLVNVALDEDPDLIKGRLMTAMNYIDQETDILDDETCKLVVFTAHNATLVQFLKLFNTRYADMGIHAVAFGKHMDRDELEDSVYAFQNNPACRVIICDETGGEGRNFQNASQIIHLDLPWNANALEQRIGRLDRLGRDPNMDVLSVVLYADTSVEEQLFHIWKDGMKLFEQSLSGLEIITGELNELIVDALLDDYYTGLTNAFDDILDQAEEMRESVEDEQDFDLGATLYRPLSQGIDNVLGIYASEDDNLFATAMMGWGKQAGLSPEKPTSSGLIEFRESTFSVNAARQSLFIPPVWDKYTNSSIMRREGRLLGSFERRTAATREDILFFAPGDPVYDSIISNAVGCSRGRCTGIETVAAYNYDGLVFIYNIAPKLDELLENGMPLQTLAQYRMYLPLKQIIVTVPLTARSKEVPEKEIINTLLALRPNSVNHLGRRGGSKMSISPLEHFISRTPPSTWEPLVDKASATAYKRACARLEKRSNFEAAEKEMQRVLNGYRSECISYEREVMDSKEVLQQYIVGAMKSQSAIAELEKKLVDTSDFLKMQEAARSRYVIGFIRRVVQFKREEASAKDICLNIRDLILILGRVKLTEKLYTVVKEYGTEFDLVCENDLQVSCLHHIPEWLEPHQYIKDVYALRHDNGIELETESSGDAILATHTGFNAYKSFEQKVAVHTALNLPNGHTLLISLPTGGGKSLVTQLLASSSDGLTVVIVPTVALALCSPAKLDQWYRDLLLSRRTI